MKDKIVSIIVTALCTALLAILSSLFSEFLPIIFPSLEKVSTGLYLKLILFLLIVIALLIIGLFFSLQQSKIRKPLSWRGKYGKIFYMAEIDYTPLSRDREININIHWLCPKHKISMDERQQAGENYLPFCENCQKAYHFEGEKDPIYSRRAYSVVKNQILRKINLL